MRDTESASNHGSAAPASRSSRSTLATPPTQWPWALASPPLVSSDRGGWETALLRRWRGTSPVMVQPPLDQNYIVMHLGGAKRVERRRDGPAVTTIVDEGSLTFVPAGTASTWRTSGPIDFAHLYLSPQQIDRVVTDEFGRESRGTSLIDKVGCSDPMLKPLMETMLTELESAPKPSKLRLDCLLQSLLIRLVSSHVSRMHPVSRCLDALAPYRLQRVLAFIDAHLAHDLMLADLVNAAGTSQFHFSRAFLKATGYSPYRYLIRRRIEHGKVLLLTSCETLETVSRKCGFNSSHQFAVMFKRETGTGPKRFRMMH